MLRSRTRRLPHKLHLIKNKWHVLVGIPVEIQHTYKQKDKRLQRSTSTSDKKLALEYAPTIVEEIEREFSDRLTRLDSFVEGLRHILEREGFEVSEWYTDGRITYSRTPTADEVEGGWEYVDDSGDWVKSNLGNWTQFDIEKLNAKPISIKNIKKLLWEDYPGFEISREYAKNYISLAQLITSLGYSIPKNLLGYISEDMRSTFMKMTEPSAQMSIREFTEHSLKLSQLYNEKGGKEYLERLGTPVTQIKLEPDAVIMPMFSDWSERYIADHKKNDSADVHAKRLKSCAAFLKVCGDNRLDEYDKVHMLEMARYLDNDENGKQWANKTIKNYYSYARQAFTYAGTIRGITGKVILPSHPFHEVSLKDYGYATKPYLPLTEDELLKLFKLDMPQQDYVLLSALITTGMRLDEMALMTWERVAEYKGILSFGLLAYDENVLVKNTGSKRFIPVPEVMLPILGKPKSGRLFDYRKDKEGKAENAASKALMRHIRIITSHPQKAVHSLRGNFKDLMRDLEISKELNDFITGHRQGDVAGDTYGDGNSMKKRLEAINKVQHPWLTQKA